MSYFVSFVCAECQQDVSQLGQRESVREACGHLVSVYTQQATFTGMNQGDGDGGETSFLLQDCCTILVCICLGILTKFQTGNEQWPMFVNPSFHTDLLTCMTLHNNVTWLIFSTTNWRSGFDSRSSQRGPWTLPASVIVSRFWQKQQQKWMWNPLKALMCYRTVGRQVK